MDKNLMNFERIILKMFNNVYFSIIPAWVMPDCMGDNSCYCQVIWEVTHAIVKTYLSGDLFM